VTLAVSCPPAYVRLRTVPSAEPPLDEQPLPRLRLVRSYTEDRLPFDSAAAGFGDADFGRRPTPRAELPDPRPWAGRLIVATMEALAGRRPVQQLMPWTDDAVYAQVSRAVRRRSAADSVPRVLSSVHVSEPADGVAEVCAVVTGAERTRAVVARLEGTDGRWRCTTLQLL